MAVDDFLLAPLGLLALLSLIPLLLLYLVRRKPSELRIPTVQFLLAEDEERSTRRVLSRFQRSLLLLVQASVLILVALALAGPYLTATSDVTAGEAVLVVDRSASMATSTGATSRFERATALARRDLPRSTTIVTVDDTARVVASNESPDEATATLRGLSVADLAGDLRSGIDLATTVADPEARIVVFSDFADESDWRAGVDAARARDHRVELVQVDAGGADNVGIVDLDLGRTGVTATIKNTGQRPATRTVGLGDQRESVSLQPDDVATVGFDVPAGGGELALTPRDSFPTDDVVPLAAPATDSIRVLVLTSDENVFLTTALAVIDEVDVTVRELPAPVTRDYDVVVFSAVDPDRLLGGNLEAARDTRAAGGGVVVVAQRNLQRIPYGDLLPIVPGGVIESQADPAVVADPLTAGITFPPPRDHVSGDLRSGLELVRAPTGGPLLVTAREDGGQTLYYGYFDESAGFQYEFNYPVFWKRAMYYAAGRPSLEELNLRTGDRLTFQSPTEVQTPRGVVRSASVALDRVGVYETRDRRYGAALLSDVESNVTGADVATGSDDRVVAAPGRISVRSVVSLVPLFALGGIVLLLLELVVLVRRGDL